MRSVGRPHWSVPGREFPDEERGQGGSRDSAVPWWAPALFPWCDWLLRRCCPVLPTWEGPASLVEAVFGDADVPVRLFPRSCVPDARPRTAVAWSPMLPALWAASIVGAVACSTGGVGGMVACVGRVSLPRDVHAVLPRVNLWRGLKAAIGVPGGFTVRVAREPRCGRP